MSKKEKRFDARQWVDRQLDVRTNTALNQKHSAFAQDHSHTSSAQLIAYVQSLARERGKTPYQQEVIGGSFLAYRFGSWENLLRLAELPAPTRPKDPRWLYRQERELQVKLFREEKVLAKQQRAKHSLEKSKQAQARNQERTRRDMAWGEAHSGDTNGQLLAYIRACADDLGRSPLVKEVLGGEYIRSRFVSWPIVLQEAGLPLPEGMKPPTKKMLAAYAELQRKMSITWRRTPLRRL